MLQDLVEEKQTLRTSESNFSLSIMFTILYVIEILNPSHKDSPVTLFRLGFVPSHGEFGTKEKGQRDHFCETEGVLFIQNGKTVFGSHKIRMIQLFFFRMIIPPMANLKGVISHEVVSVSETDEWNSLAYFTTWLLDIINPLNLFGQKGYHYYYLLTKSFDRTKVQNFKLMYQQLRMPLFLGKYDFKTKFHSSLLQMLITLKNLSFHVIFGHFFMQRIKRFFLHSTGYSMVKIHY